MKGFARFRPSPALVVACIGLGIALGGTAFATVLQVPRNSVGTPQLRNGAATTAKIRNSAVTSAKVRNRSLLRVDFAPDQLPVGPTGPQGPAGPAGPAGVSGVERVEVTTTTNSVSPKSSQMPCPSGKRLVGGGARLNGGGQQVALQSSFPDSDNIFRATGREVVGTVATWSLTVFAICATAS
jgi:hypothetical protein